MDGIPQPRGLRAVAVALACLPWGAAPLVAAPGEEPPATGGKSEAVLPTGCVLGRLTRSLTGEPLQGTVRVHGSGVKETVATTDVHGWFRIEGLPLSAPFDLEASSADLPTTTRRGLWTPYSGLLDLGDVVLGAPVRDALQVVDWTGKPISGAKATYHHARPLLTYMPAGTKDSFGPAIASAASDDAGRILLPSLPPGPGLLRVEAAGFATALEYSDLREGVPAGARTLVLQPGHALRGAVRARDGRPLAGVVVVARHHWKSYLDELTTVSDSSGAYRIEGLAPGRYELMIRVRPDLVLQLLQVEIPGVTVLPIEVPGGSLLEGRVLRESDGRPEPHAVVEASLMGSGSLDSALAVAVADGDGNYSMHDLPQGRFREIRILGGGWIPAEAPENRGDRFEVPDTSSGTAVGLTSLRDLHLRPAPTVSGRMLDPEGRGLPHVRVDGVVLTDLGHQDLRPAWSGEDGSYRLEIPYTGRAALVVKPAEGYAEGCPRSPYPLSNGKGPDTQYSFQVEEGTRLVRNFTIHPGGTVAGTIRSWTGAPLEGVIAGIHERKSGPGGGGRTRPSGPDGAFLVRGTRPGLVETLFAWASLPDGSQGWSRPIVLEAGAGAVSKDADIRMEPPASLEGRLVREDGAPPAGSDLRLRAGLYSDWHSWPPTTLSLADPIPVGPDGRFRVEGLHQGTYTFLFGTDGCRMDVGSNVTLAPGERRGGILLRFPAVQPLAGRVVDANGRPVPGAVLSLCPERGNPAYAGGGVPGSWRNAVIVTTDEEGRFRTATPEAGRIEIETFARGFTNHRTVGTVGIPVDDIVLQAQIPVRGRVMDRVTKAPLGGIVVRAWSGREGPTRTEFMANSRNGYLRGEATSEADGTFLLEGMDAGAYSLRFTDPRGDSLRKYVTLVVENVAAGGAPVLAYMVRGGTIQGRVLFADGVPVEGRRVSVITDGPGAPASPFGGWSTTTDPAGMFRVGGLPLGKFTILVSRGNGSLNPVAVKDVVVDTDDLEIRIPR